MASINNNLNQELSLDMKLRVAEYNIAMAVKGANTLEAYITQVKRTVADLKASVSSLFETVESIPSQYLKTLLSTLDYFSRELALSDVKKRAYEGFYEKSVQEYNMLDAQAANNDSSVS